MGEHPRAVVLSLSRESETGDGLCEEFGVCVWVACVCVCVCQSLRRSCTAPDAEGNQGHVSENQRRTVYFSKSGMMVCDAAESFWEVLSAPPQHRYLMTRDLSQTLRHPRLSSSPPLILLLLHPDAAIRREGFRSWLTFNVYGRNI